MCVTETLVRLEDQSTIQACSRDLSWLAAGWSPKARRELWAEATVASDSRV